MESSIDSQPPSASLSKLSFVIPAAGKGWRMPSTACDIQALLGSSNAVALDVSAACSGFLYGLTLAEGYIATGRGEIALVIATEKMSSIVNWEDRSTCVLFGDGAGAAVLRSSEGPRGILGTHHGSDGNLAELLYRPAGGAAIPMDEEVLRNRDHLLQMSGREVFKNAVRSMAESASSALQQSGLTPDDVDLMIPHQANIRIIEATARYANVPMDRVFVNVDRYGNMSSATIPVAMDEALEEGRLHGDMNVLLVAFGAGLTWGAGDAAQGVRAVRAARGLDIHGRGRAGPPHLVHERREFTADASCDT